MSRTAVDVVLLPCEAVMDRAIEANRELLKQFDKKIVLNKDSCLPHISLAMGCIDNKDVADIGEVLGDIAGRCSLGELRVVSIHTETNSAGEEVLSFEVEKTEELQSLHERIMEEVEPYFAYEATADALISGHGVSDSSLRWINNYRQKSSFERFFPHITIGFGEIRRLELPINFTASKLALCHLGDHCTCRKILISIDY